MSKHHNYPLWNITAAAILMMVLSVPSMVYGASPDAPTDLVTQYVTNPMAVDTMPHFSWALRDADRDERQTACQIIVASALASINGDVGNIWDSGKTFSSKSTQVHYAGNPLASDTRYWWKVRTWDKDGNASPWSVFANFDMGLTTADWTASHIWDGTDNGNNFAYFRKKFAIPAGKTIAIAKLYVSAHDDYNLYINGKQIGIGPAFSNPYKRMYYIGYDITASLSAGDNVITSICHWHGLFRMSGGKSAVPAFILEMRIKYTDGTSQTIKTDNSWKVLATTPWLESPHAFQGISWSDVRCVENYDARKEIPGWQAIAFDDSSWANATVVDRCMFMLKAQYVATDAVQQILNPVSITQSGTAWIVDFGMCYNGWPRLTMTGNKTGSVVTVRYAEVPNDFRDYDTYTCKGGTETWQPDIRYESFRCLKIEGYAGTLTEANIKAAWKYATPDRQGAFECSNTLFNNIYNLCERSCRQNIQEGVASTDAWRETSSYTADAHLMTGVCLYNYKNSMVLRKTIADYTDEQYANGNLDSHCPNSGLLDIPEWTLHWFFLLWNQYLFFGDRDILAEHYAVMQKVVDYFIGHQSAATHLLANTPGDLKISDWPNDPTDNSGASLTAQNCLYYQSLIIASKIAAVLGKEGDSSRYESIAAKVKIGINTHLFDGVEKYRDCSGSSKYLPLSSCWPLVFDIVPADKKEAVIAYVKNSGFSAHVYGGYWAFDALFHCDQGPFIYSLLNQPSQRWGRMLDPAYSLACWEDWDPVPAGGGMSYNHAWSCYPARFFLSGVLGICPVAPGYSVFEVRPQMSGLNRASGTVATVKGNIVAGWTMVDKDFDLKVSVPANCTALVYLPTFGSDNIDVYEGTTLIWRRGAVVRSIPGVSFKTTEPQRLVWQTGSGSYAFKVKLNDQTDPAADLSVVTVKRIDRLSQN